MQIPLEELSPGSQFLRRYDFALVLYVLRKSVKCILSSVAFESCLKKLGCSRADLRGTIVSRKFRSGSGVSAARLKTRSVASHENIPAYVQAGFCHEVCISFDSATSLR